MGFKKNKYNFYGSFQYEAIPALCLAPLHCASHMKNKVQPRK